MSKRFAGKCEAAMPCCRLTYCRSEDCPTGGSKQQTDFHESAMPRQIFSDIANDLLGFLNELLCKPCKPSWEGLFDTDRRFSALSALRRKILLPLTSKSVWLRGLTFELSG